MGCSSFRRGTGDVAQDVSYVQSRPRKHAHVYVGDGPLSLWDWYTGLRRLGNTVEFWLLPNGAHNVFKVGERMQTNQLLGDWFRFWLQGAEDPDPRKKDQYARWRDLRKFQ